MLFHWLRDYGKGSARATMVVDAIFADARRASPEIFDADSRKEPAQQAKFEHMCPWAALHLMQADAQTARAVLEVLIDRIEIGLREGGVGDMKIGVHVRKYAAALHGRVRRYASCMDSGDWEALTAAMAEHGIAPTLTDALKAAVPAPAAAPNPKKGVARQG